MNAYAILCAVMNENFYSLLTKKALNGEDISDEECLEILTSDEVEILPLTSAAFKVRKEYWGNLVTVHILDNVQNGGCGENCTYCAQSKSSKAEIKAYPMKSEEQIMEEAKIAYESGAFRHCLVFSGTGPSKKRIDQLCKIIKDIKQKYNMEVCVSPGHLDQEDAAKLKEAGLNRLNHNINTSERFYSKICTSHSFQERMTTLEAAKSQGLEICSGIIVGMGEEPKDIVEAARTLHRLKIQSMPVNFFLDIPGLALKKTFELTPEYCLRVLCLFRFLNPKAEIRAAAGREVHLRQLQAMAMYAANSLFVDGYLNTEGSNLKDTLQLIKDAGLDIKSDKKLAKLLQENI
jgi:biotin synthase